MLDPSCDMTPLELFEAYYDCRRTKRNSANALLFEENLERNLMNLYHDLRSGEYRPGRSICFVAEHPKVREVWAADFRDRIVHHLLYNRVSERFHRRFIHDSYACIPGKGTHRAVARMEHMARSVTRNHTIAGCVLKMDVANFFVSIDRQVLDGQLAKHIHEPWWLALCRTLLHHDPTQDVYVKSPSWLMCRVPAHKSLFNSGGRGLPIGNLSSQFFANVYMDAIDQHAKHALKLQHWVRYVDDIVVFGRDGSELAALAPQVDRFLQERLRIRLHPNKTSINKIEHGFDALGFVVRPYARYLRRSTVQNAFAKLDDMCRERRPAHDIRAVANSYFGIMGQANAWRERSRMAAMLRGHGHIVALQANRMFTERIPL